MQRGEAGFEGCLAGGFGGFGGLGEVRLRWRGWGELAIL